MTKEWLSSSLTWWFNGCLLFTEVSFLAAIITLDRVSASNQGLLTIPQHDDTSFVESHIRKNYSLLWTSLPSFIFSVYGLLWAYFVSANTDRQPYIELYRSGTAQRTIMLDYKSIPPLYNWLIAFRRKHAHLAIGLLLNILVSIAMVPLSGHLLDSKLTAISHVQSLNFTSSFNSDAITAKTNLQPFIDLASAMLVYGSSPPPWMTEVYAFEDFSVSGVGNTTANTTAYSAVLDCRTITPSISSVNTGGGDTVDLAMTFNDRGCAVTQDLAVDADTPLYALSWYTYCDPYGRFGMISGHYSAEEPIKIGDLTVTSCVPTYWKTNGSLTVTNEQKSIVTFVGAAEEQIQPNIHFVFENALRDYSVYNPSAASLGDAVGSLIYATAAQRNSLHEFEAATVLNATASAFSTIYAALTRNVLLQSDNRPGTGSLSIASNRLVVVSAVAYTIVVFLFLIILCHLTLFIYARRHRTMLDEEPIGLLGNAKLLMRSDVFEVVDDFQKRHPHVPEMQKYIKKHYREGALWWDDDRVMVDRLDE